MHPNPDELGQVVHEQDVAEVAVAALLHDHHVGQAYTLTGPAQLTLREMAAAIADAIGRELTFRKVSAEEALAHYVSLGFPEQSTRFILGLGGYEGGELPDFSDFQFIVSPDFEAVTGKPYRTFAQWAHDHAADFTT